MIEENRNLVPYSFIIIRNSDSITSLIFQINEGKLKVSGVKHSVEASYENFAEVKCHMAKSRTRRSTGAVNTPGQFAIVSV